MLHECRGWADRHAGDLATGTDRISIQRAGDSLQPAQDDRGFLEPAPAWWRRLCLHRPDARILPLKEPLPRPPASGGGREARPSPERGRAKVAPRQWTIRIVTGPVLSTVQLNMAPASH